MEPPPTGSPFFQVPVRAKNRTPGYFPTNGNRAMKNGKTYLILSIILLLAAVILFTGKQEPTYTLGVISNFEGKNTQSADDALKSIKLAYGAFKEKHPSSFNLTILPVDDSWNPAIIPEAYGILKDRCDFILFMTTSTAFLSIFDEVNANSGKLHLLAGTINSAISDRDDNVVRNGIDDRLEQKLIAGFLRSRDAGTVLVIQDNEKNLKYNSMAFKRFSEHYPHRVVHTVFSPTRMDLSGPLGKFRKERFKYVYIIAGGSPREEGIIIQHLRKSDPGVRIITTPWTKGETFLESMGQNRENVIIPTYVRTDAPAYLDYLNRFRTAYGVSPGESVAAILCHDLSGILFKAVHKTGSSDVEILKKEILAREYDAIAGRIKFNRYGDLLGKLYFYRFTGDRREYLD